MDEEKVVAEEAQPQKVHFWKKPLVRKIAKISLIVVATAGVGFVGWKLGANHAAKLALPETAGAAEVIDTTVVE